MRPRPLLQAPGRVPREASGRRAPGCGLAGGSDLADQVERRSEGLLAFLPLGRADLVRMGGDVLRSLDLAQQLGGIAADAAGVDLDDLDLARRVDHEGAAVGDTVSLDQ